MFYRAVCAGLFSDAKMNGRSTGLAVFFLAIRCAANLN